MRLALALFAFLTLVSPICAEPPSSTQIAFAVGSHLVMWLGKWSSNEPHWLPADQMTDRPGPLTDFHLYGMPGLLADVHLSGLYKTSRVDTGWNWNAAISEWSEKPQFYALAVHGALPTPALSVRALPLTDPDAVRITASYLKEHQALIAQPYLSEVWEWSPDERGGRTLFICAHSAESELSDSKSATIYDVALVNQNRGAKAQTFALASDIHFKPAKRSLTEQWDLYGVRPYYRWVSVADIDGDGAFEIALYKAIKYEVGIQHIVTLFTPTRDGYRPLLSANSGY